MSPSDQDEIRESPRRTRTTVGHLEFRLVPRPIGGNPYHEIYRNGPQKIGNLRGKVFFPHNTMHGPVEATIDELRSIVQFADKSPPA